jgi:hypothetical protein
MDFVDRNLRNVITPNGFSHTRERNLTPGWDATRFGQKRKKGTQNVFRFQRFQ